MTRTVAPAGRTRAAGGLLHLVADVGGGRLLVRAADVDHVLAHPSMNARHWRHCKSHQPGTGSSPVSRADSAETSASQADNRSSAPSSVTPARTSSSVEPVGSDVTAVMAVATGCPAVRTRSTPGPGSAALARRWRATRHLTEHVRRSARDHGGRSSPQLTHDPRFIWRAPRCSPAPRDRSRCPAR